MATFRVPQLCKNGDGRGYITIPKSGKKRLYFGIYGTAECQKAYDRFADQCRDKQEVPSVAAPRTIAELVKVYIKWAEKHYVADGEPTKTFESQEAAALFVSDNFGREPSTSVGPRMVARLQDLLLEGKWKRTSIKDCMGRIKTMIRWWAKMDYIAGDRYQAARAVPGIRKDAYPELEPEPIKPVAMEDVEAVLPYLPPQIVTMIRLQYLCGMRPQDVCGIRPADVDRSGDIWLYTVPKHKTGWKGKQLVKAIPRAAQALLAPFLLREATAYCFSPREAMEWHYENRATTAKERKTPVYPSELRRREKIKAERRRKKVRARGKRERYDTASYRRAISYGFERAAKLGVALATWHPNQLRHTIGTEIAQTLGIQACARWLGHSTLNAAQIYAEIQKSEIIAIAKALDARQAEPPPADRRASEAG